MNKFFLTLISSLLLFSQINLIRNLFFVESISMRLCYLFKHLTLMSLFTHSLYTITDVYLSFCFEFSCANFFMVDVVVLTSPNNIVYKNLKTMISFTDSPLLCLPWFQILNQKNIPKFMNVP